jgi:hypothetical protein
LAIVWKRPRPVSADKAEELLADVEQRVESVSRDRAAGPLALLQEMGHPMFRAAMKSSRRDRTIAGLACAGLPLVVFVAVVFAAASPIGPRVAGWAAGLFASLWPLVCFVGAAVGAGAGVIHERERLTAVPLVLTPMPKRVIAAAKVIPAALPYVCGAAAAMPLLALAGAVEPLSIRGGIPTPLVIWPLRVAAPFCGGFSPLRLTLPGVFVGVLMCVTDVITVWAAAHWGAAYGVRLGRLPLLAGAVAWRWVLTFLYFGLCTVGAAAVTYVLSLTVGVVLALFSYRLAVVVVAGIGLVLFVIAWRRYVLDWPVRMVLSEFSHFDELAQDDFQPRPLRGWEIFSSYGERT